METVLVGLDPPPAGPEPLRWAADYCRLTGSELVAVAVQPLLSDPPRAWYEAELARLRKEAEASLDALAPPVPHRLEACDGDPSSIMAELARGDDAALIVVGGPGRDGFRSLALGRHDLPVPLVIVPPSCCALLGDPVVVGLDGSTADGDALAWAVRFADAARASVCAVYAPDPETATHPQAPSTSTMGEKETLLSQEVAAAAPSGVRITTRVEDGDALTALTTVAEQLRASVVVVGRGADAHAGGAPVGRVPAELSLETNRPVVIVPPASRMAGA